MAFPAFLDTCVLFGATLTDVTLRIAEEGAFSPLWSQGVLDELVEALVRNERTTPAKARRRVEHMRRAFPAAEVEDYELLVPSMTCDPKDRHVLAAAVSGRAEVLVTFNTSDFPESSTAPHDITVVHPDQFLLDQLDLHPRLVHRAVEGLLTTASRPPLASADLLDALVRTEVPQFAEALRGHLASTPADRPTEPPGGTA